MVEDNVIQWAKDNLSQGFSLPELEQSLKDNGYSPEDVKEIMTAVQQPAAAPQAAAPVAQPIAQPVVTPQPATTPQPTTSDPGATGSGELILEAADEPLVPEPQPVAQPTPQPVAQPVAQPAPQPVAQPIAQPIEQPVAQPVAQPAPQPAAAPVPTAAPIAPATMQASPGTPTVPTETVKVKKSMQKKWFAVAAIVFVVVLVAGLYITGFIQI